MTHRYRRRLPQAGFTLVEIAVVIVILAVLLSMALVMTRGVAAAQRRSVTATRLAAIDLALVQYIQVNKRLPCPANGTIASTGVNPGIEVRDGATQTCTGNQQNGVVPWITLGLGEIDATDGWERRITYRTDTELVMNNGMDMSWCDPAGTEAGPGPSLCNSACSSATLLSCTPPAFFLVGKGLEVRNLAGASVMIAPNTGAAYVLISHGESGGGAYLNSGVLSASTSTDGTEEQKNYASLALQAYYLDDATSDVAGASHFDDVVLRRTVLSAASKAGLGPRSH